MSALSRVKKLTELLTLALDDYEKVKVDPNYKIEMDVWYYKEPKSPCKVCMAGCLIAKQLLPKPKDGTINLRPWDFLKLAFTERNLPKDGTINLRPWDFDWRTERFLLAIEGFRRGDFDAVFDDFFLAFNLSEKARIDKMRYYGKQIAQLSRKYKWNGDASSVKKMRYAVEDLKTMGV